MPNDPHYLAIVNLPRPSELEIGALGRHEFPAGDYVYVGRAKTGFDARLERHRRTSDKSVRWHVDYLRRAARWVEARTPEASSECELADRIASLEGAERFVDGFGASDCGCGGHLVRHEGPTRRLPGALWRGEGVEAEFVERPNRFVVRARLGDGSVARAYLPNTSRLTELLERDRRMLLDPADDPDRSTAYTVKRFWDGTWVSVEAMRAETMIEQRIERRGRLPGLGAVDDWDDQVEHADHRFDFRLRLADGRRPWLEVKSLSRNFDGTALLSGTPSSRGVAHLAALAELADSGEPAAVAFVVQHNDARTLAVGNPGVDAPVDDDWIEAVRRARRAGVTVLAYGCRVTPSNAWIARRLEVT